MAGRDVRRHEQGFTLLEVIIAVLVLSVGLLGIAGLQLKALQGAHLAHQRTVASLAAQDARERVWYELAARIESEADTVCPPEEDLTTITAVGSEWHDHWEPYLPGLVTDAIEPQPDCSFEITVDWTENRFQNEGDVSRLTYEFTLPVLEEEGA
ncbi:MAG: type IV pilus modification protein PilV [Pseudomonadota bacterium]